jgi:hypothetical protein
MGVVPPNQRMKQTAHSHPHERAWTGGINTLFHAGERRATVAKTIRCVAALARWLARKIRFRRRGPLTDRALDAFFSTATQYYVTGRCAVFAGLVPVSGNLLHHAVEMYLKGALSNSMTLKELKDLQHDLRKTWREFKTRHADPALRRFDDVVASLHRFEKLRYPDSTLTDGMLAEVGLKRPKRGERSKSPSRSEPRYELWLEDVDALVGAIFVAAPANPSAFFSGLTSRAKGCLREGNAEPWAS